MPNKFYLSFGRHGHYGTDTPILREDMLKAYLSGEQLKSYLPKCETVYCSPLPRTTQTARFTALGLKCDHILQIDALNEGTSKFMVQQFINNLLINTNDDVKYYHFVTHLPVLEKLGLPFLGAGEVCLLTAESINEMLMDNFQVQIIKQPEITIDLWHDLNLKISLLAELSADEIYNKLLQISNHK